MVFQLFQPNTEKRCPPWLEKLENELFSEIGWQHTGKFIVGCCKCDLWTLIHNKWTPISKNTMDKINHFIFEIKSLLLQNRYNYKISKKDLAKRIRTTMTIGKSYSITSLKGAKPLMRAFKDV